MKKRENRKGRERRVCKGHNQTESHNKTSMPVAASKESRGQEEF